MTAEIARSVLDEFHEQWPDARSDLDPHTASLIDALLAEWDSGGDAHFLVEPHDGDSWTVGARIPDRLGTLSVISGLFTNSGLDIVRADTFTLVTEVETPLRIRRRGRRELGPQLTVPRRRFPTVARSRKEHALVVFRLRSTAGQTPDWEEVRRALKVFAEQVSAGDVESARSGVIDRFAHQMRRESERVERRVEMRISTDSTSLPQHTLLTIRSVDTVGFLFAFTNALTSLRVNVRRAKVRTINGRVEDTFWLTDSSLGKIESEHRLRQIRVAAALIKQFTHLLPNAPDPAQALRQFNSLTAQLLARPDWVSELHDLESPGVLETLAELMGFSRFLWEDFLRMQHDNLFPVLLDPEGLDQARSRNGLADDMRRAVAHAGPYEERVRVFNQVKDREMFRVDLRYITGRTDFSEFAQEVTTLAEAVVQQAFEMSIEKVAERRGLPAKAPCAWAIMALGKFGGRDMGFGSDIELIFVYEREGTADERGTVNNSSFFEDSVREFLMTIETREHGVFEIDLRLRPYGSQGPMASSLAALADYYGLGGDVRPFERLALVRMRPVVGDDDLARRVMAIQESFVYSSEPVDMENVLHLRQRQADELVSPGKLNAKLSPGGVVDIEYYVQAWQVSCGRDDPDMRVTGTVEAAEALQSKRYVTQELAERVRESYQFLRQLIEALRAVGGHAKDLDVPPTDSKEFDHLAHRLGVSSPARLDALLSEHMDFARGLWENRPPL